MSVILTLVLAAVARISAALSDGKLSPLEIAELVQLEADDIAKAFPQDAPEAGLAHDVAAAFAKFWLAKHPLPPTP